MSFEVECVSFNCLKMLAVELTCSGYWSTVSFGDHWTEPVPGVDMVESVPKAKLLEKC